MILSSFLKEYYILLIPLSSTVYFEDSRIYLVIGSIWSLSISILIPLGYDTGALAMLFSAIINLVITVIVVEMMGDNSTKLNTWGYEHAGLKTMGRFGIIVYIFLTALLTRQLSIWL